MRVLVSAGLVVASIVMVACSDNDKKQDNPPASVEGNWQAAAYGQAINYQDGTVRFYNYTTDYCLLAEEVTISEDELKEEGWELSDNNTKLREQQTFKGINIREPVFVRVDHLPESCQQNLLVRIGDEDYQKDPEKDFEVFWQTFSEYYLSFSVKGVDWDTQRVSFRSEITEETTDNDLFMTLAEMVEPLKDGHVSIFSEDNNAGFGNHVTTIDLLTAEFTEANGDIDSQEKYEQYVEYVISQIDLMDEIRIGYADDESIKVAANEEVIWYLTSDNIGVLIIDSMSGFSTDDEDNIDAETELTVLDQAITSALTDLQDTSGLIIDVRDNEGGFDAASQIIMKHFLDTERHLYSKQARLGAARTEQEEYHLMPAEDVHYLKDIVLLTSRNTASAAEVFTLMMRNLPNVTLMGEPTQGILSDSLAKILPNGFTFSLSNEFYLSPEGEWFEHNGIPVDLEIAYGTLEQRLEGEDLGLEAAYSHLTN